MTTLSEDMFCSPDFRTEVRPILATIKSLSRQLAEALDRADFITMEELSSSIATQCMWLNGMGYGEEALIEYHGAIKGYFNG